MATVKVKQSKVSIGLAENLTLEKFMNMNVIMVHNLNSKIQKSRCLEHKDDDI